MVHRKFLELVQDTIRKRNINFDSAQGRSLEKEMMYYGQSTLR